RDWSSDVCSSDLQYIVDHGTQRCKSDSAGDEKKIFSFELVFHREMISVWSADCDLVAHFQAVKIIRQDTTLFDAEFLIFFVGRRGGDGKHTLADTRSTEH